MKFSLLLALESITAVKLTNDFILQFWSNVTSSEIDQIAFRNGYINQETWVQDTFTYSLPELHKPPTDILDPITRTCKYFVDLCFYLTPGLYGISLLGTL